MLVQKIELTTLLHTSGLQYKLKVTGYILLVIQSLHIPVKQVEMVLSQCSTTDVISIILKTINFITKTFVQMLY